MPLTAATKTDLYRFFVLAFDAAPGVTYMNQLAAASDSGMSVQQIVNEFTKKSEFTNVYFNFLTNQEFATKFVNNSVASTTSAAAKAEAVDQIVAALNSGYSRGDVIYQVFSNLANLTGDAKWGDTAKLLSNQVAYATYYTETLGLGSEATPSLSALRAVVANVTASSPTDAGSIAAALNPVAGQTFNLTTGIDNMQPGPGNDTYTATAGTWNTGDVVNGGDGTDTLNATLSGTGPALTAASLVNVEVLNVTASPNPATLNLTGVAGLKEVNNLSSANGATLSVSGLGNTVNTTITGGNTATTIGYTTAVTAATATADAATVTLAGVGVGTSFNTAGIETLTVASTTAANTATVSATGVTKLVITGDQALTFNGAVGGTTIASVDASAATGAVTLTTGAGAGGTAATGVSVTAPSAATAGTFTVTTGGNKDTVVLGAGASVVDTGAGSDTITVGAGAATVTTGTGNDTVTLGASADTVRFAEAGGTNADTINNFGATDVLAVNLGSAAVAGTSAASANATFGTVQTGGTSPVLSNVNGAGTGTAIAFQIIAPNATATSGTVSGTSNVLGLNAFSDGTVGGLITALGTTATTGITTTSAGKFLLVSYSVGNIAQVWAFAGDTTLNTDIDQAELSLVATINGIGLGGLTAANFSTYLTAATTTATASNSGQTISLTGLLNTVQSVANASGQFLTAANDTINVGVGTLPTGAATATSGLTIIDPSSTDADVMNATVLGDWAAGSVVSGIETINLNMLVAGTTFSAAAKTPGTSQFGLTGSQDFVVTAMPNGGGVTLGSGYTGQASFGMISVAGTSDSAVINLSGSTATSNAAGASVVYTSGAGLETATVNVTADSSIRMSNADLFAAAGNITATNLEGAGNLTVWGAAADLGTMNLNASGVKYTGALTLRPTSNASMDFSTNTGNAGLVTGIRTINLSSAGAYSNTITLNAANSPTNAAVTVSYAPTTAAALGAWTIAQQGSGLNDAVTLSLGSTATGSGNITATSIETFTVSSARASSDTLTLGNIALTDGAGTQTITVTAASTVGAGTFTADTVNFSGVTGNVTGLTLANSAGASFTGGSGNTTVAGSAQADVINTGIGADSVSGAGGADIINAGDGANTINGGAGADVLTGGAGVDTYEMVVADVGDTITNFTVASDKIDWNTALASQSGAVTTPSATNAFQAAAAGTAIAATTTVFELTGTTVAAGAAAADIVTALTAGTANGSVAATSNMLIIVYIAGGGAQIWNFVGTGTNGTNIDAAELTLVATLTGVAADALTGGNFI
jgi:hypothetical protein